MKPNKTLVLVVADFNLQRLFGRALELKCRSNLWDTNHTSSAFWYFNVFEWLVKQERTVRGPTSFCISGVGGWVGEILLL